MSARVLGIDPSLTCTGLAGHGWTDTIKPGDRRGADRLVWIRDTLTDRWLAGVDLVAMEGPAYSRQGQAGHHEGAGLWWLIRIALASKGVPAAVVTPGSLKLYATGKGGAGKDVVMREVARRFPWFEGGEDEADAVVLAAMAADHLGEPMVAMPATHRAALAKVEWPELVAPVLVGSTR